MRMPVKATALKLTQSLLWLAAGLSVLSAHADAQSVPVVRVEGQPLAAAAARLLDALDYLGTPLPEDTSQAVRAAIRSEDGRQIQQSLDPQVLFAVSINPELRVKVQRGPADPVLQQAGFTPVLIKVLNDATLSRALRIGSPQAGPPYAGAVESTLLRQAQTELNDNENRDSARRFLQVEMFQQSPLTDHLSGLPVEYVVGLIYSSEAGQREATIIFDVGAGTQDLGFRSEVPVLFSIRPAIPVRLSIRDADGQPTTARLEFRDAAGRVYPPQARRLAPDLFFQPQIYRTDGQTVLLPPGHFQLESSRGPEYVRTVQSVQISESPAGGTADPSGAAAESAAAPVIHVRLQRWIDPSRQGFYCGDHHIHGAGCAHYDNPTAGVTPSDMFAQVKGEGLHVGCVLTWGPCFEHQRNYFSPMADTVSEPFTILKYDLEISGFGSAALGHVCLLNLRDQVYPGSDGTKTQGWPTWTVPVMRWARQQGGITGYPHSALHVDPAQAAAWHLRELDRDQSDSLSEAEAQGQLLPEPFASIDQDGDRLLSANELQRSADRMADTLPNLALPAMDGGGAMEIVVSTPEGVCDFISAMDTARIPEWNTWYHLLNCGFPLKLSGETDFPCMSSRRVGQGRVYVQLGDIQQLDFAAWCTGLAAGRSYVSDGYAHATAFRVQGTAPGTGDVQLAEPTTVRVEASVAFAAAQPRAVAYGTLLPAKGQRMVGDTVNLHAERDTGFVQGGDRLVEVIVNGRVAQTTRVPADGQTHALHWDLPIERSSWVALRQFPQLHTNPVSVIVQQQPLRPSRASALWCAEAVRLLWKNRQRFIAEPEREAARAAYERSLQRYLAIAAESTVDDGLRIPERQLP